MKLNNIGLTALASLKNDSVARRINVVAGGQYTRLAPARIDLEYADPATISMLQDYNGSLTQVYGDIDIAVLPDAIVCGQGAVVTRHDELVRESVAEFVAHDRVPDGLTRFGDRFGLPGGPTRRMSQPCLLVKRPWYRNYGHWLVDAASILALAGPICRSERLSVVIGDSQMPQMRRVMIDTIRAILPAVEVLVQPDNEAWSFRELHYITPLHVPPLFKLPAGLARLRDIMLPGRPEKPGPRRLFVSRAESGNPRRSLLNEAEVLTLCRQRGYELIYPEKLSVQEQALMFSQANSVVGVKGAALTNVIFCAPGTSLIVLSPADFPDPFFWDICGQKQMIYAEIFGEIAVRTAQGQNDFSIDLQRFTSMLSHVP